MELNYDFNNTCFPVLCGLSCFQCIKKKRESTGRHESPALLMAWFLCSSMGWNRCAVARVCAVRLGHSWVQLHQRRKRSFRLFAAEGEDCWRRETPRKNAAGSGGYQFVISLVVVVFYTGGSGGWWFSLRTEGVRQLTEQRSGTRRGWATSYRHGQGLRLPLQAAHHRWQR